MVDVVFSKYSSQVLIRGYGVISSHNQPSSPSHNQPSPPSHNQPSSPYYEMRDIHDPTTPYLPNSAFIISSSHNQPSHQPPSHDDYLFFWLRVEDPTCQLDVIVEGDEASYLLGKMVDCETDIREDDFIDLSLSQLTISSHCRRSVSIYHLPNRI